MEASFLTQIMLPATLAVIMFGMGLSLTTDDFVRLWKMPKPIFVGLAGQLVLLPMLAYGIAIAFGLSEDLAIGLIILSACPGGTMSNVISHLAKANLALSVTLTAITTIICVFTHRNGDQQIQSDSCGIIFIIEHYFGINTGDLVTGIDRSWCSP